MRSNIGTDYTRSQPLVCDYENNVIRLPAGIVGEIAQMLEVTGDELLGLKRAREAQLRTIDAFISKTA